MEEKEPTIQARLPYAFIMRRLHSLLGLWLIIYLLEHLFVNAQAAFFSPDHPSKFINIVNAFHSIAYLKVVEVVFLALPFLIHGIWGMRYAYTSRFNSFNNKGTSPSLPEYPKNRAFTWQRLSAWFLVLAICAHVVQMRFMQAPRDIYEGQTQHYLVRIEEDPGLNKLASQLQARVYTATEIAAYWQKLEENKLHMDEHVQDATYYVQLNSHLDELQWLKKAEQQHLKPGQVLVDAPSAGSAFLLVLRDTFKSPIMVVLYSIFVLAASFHAAHGLWTAMISWGVTLSQRSQQWMRYVTHTLMFVLVILGWTAIWGLYWRFLFQSI
ncbi:MAG: succinate dehydrogenase [Verrucomicrobia bacterium]|nr:succinate dehydrogenase [Verrucomicrobiota bacterium]MBS0645397.1 succinate dehydrogenase [Verrucomicrobiota bacterium]